MRLLILALSMVVLTALADKPMKPYMSPGQAKKIPAPPLPFAPSTKIKALSTTVPASSGTPSDPASPAYATITKFTAQYEGGKSGPAMSIKWNNWPSTNAYSLQGTTNFTTWFTPVIGFGDAGPELRVYDLEAFEFYKINKAFVSTPTKPTPAP